MKTRTSILMFAAVFFVIFQTVAEEDRYSQSQRKYYEDLCRRWASEEEGLRPDAMETYIERCRKRLMGPEEQPGNNLTVTPHQLPDPPPLPVEDEWPVAEKAEKDG